ncbi:MAG: hypothetical protein HN416_10185 [Nitrospina sp.]|nr:hypothetical protein [Nitrospina sp.]
MGKNQSGEFSVYFKCEHCPQEFSLYSFRIAVFLYGVILLANEHNGYMGITCPSCMKTTLTRIEKVRLEQIKNELGEYIVTITDLEALHGFPIDVIRFGNTNSEPPICGTDIEIETLEKPDESSYTGSALSYVTVSTFRYEDLDIEPLSENSIHARCNDKYFQATFESFQHWPRNFEEESIWHGTFSDEPSNSSQYTLCSRPIKVPADQNICRVYWFKEDDIQKLVARENKENLKIFPRHFFDSSIRESCETFSTEAGLIYKHYPGKVEQEQRLEERFAKHSAKDRLSVNTVLIKTLEDEDFLELLDDSNAVGLNLWKLKDPFKAKNVPSSLKDLDSITLEEQSRDIGRGKMFNDIWSIHTKDGVPGLYAKSFKFVLEFQELKRRTDCSTGAIWALKQKYLRDIYNSLSLLTKKNTVAEQTQFVIPEEVEKAKERSELGPKEHGQIEKEDEANSPVLNDEGTDSPTFSFYQTGEFWSIGKKGDETHLKHLKGLAFVHFLLQKPHKDIYCTNVYNLGKDPGIDSTCRAKSYSPHDSGHSEQQKGSFGDSHRKIDPIAQAAVSEELEELKSKKKMLGFSSATSDEIDIIDKQISKIEDYLKDLGQEFKEFENARTGVYSRIKSALEKIYKEAPYMKEFLNKSTILSRSTCKYSPELKKPVNWILHRPSQK